MTPLPQNTLQLFGCRHDILGHYLKAIGLLRVLAKCAASEYRDPDAEGWWNTDDGAFYLCSEKYDTAEKLTEFFEKYYQPTPVFSAWNTGGGLDEKQEIVFCLNPTPWETFWNANKETFFKCGYPKPESDKVPGLTEKGLLFSLTSKPDVTSIPGSFRMGEPVETKKGKKTIYKISVSWSDAAKKSLRDYLDNNFSSIRKIIVGKDEWPKAASGNGKPAVQTKFEKKGGVEYVFDIRAS